MDSIFKSFSISFLLRSVFAGAFFVISYYVASRGPRPPTKINEPAIFSIALPIALFAGVIAYGLHRSLVHPLIDFLFHTNYLKAIRERKPLISKRVVDALLSRWDRAVEGQGKRHCERVKRITVWADYTQLQYTSTICIALGAFVGWLIVPGAHTAYWPLIWLAVIFFVAVVLSDWRLRSVDDRCHLEADKIPASLND